jgi:hypothetical protein
MKKLTDDIRQEPSGGGVQPKPSDGDALRADDGIPPTHGDTLSATGGKSAKNDNNQEIKISKLALKTVAVTSLVFVLSISIFLSLYMLIAPSTAAEKLYDLGWYGFSARLSAAAYNRSGDINDLGNAAENAILSGNDALVFDYCNMLIQHKDYDEFVIFKNQTPIGELVIYGGFNYDYYIKGHFYAALYDRKKIAFTKSNKQTALEFSQSAMTAGGLVDYSDNNPVNYVVGRFAKDAAVSTDEIIELLSWFEESYNNINGNAELSAAAKTNRLKNLCADAYKIADMRGAELAPYRAVWTERYETVG